MFSQRGTYTLEILPKENTSITEDCTGSCSTILTDGENCRKPSVTKLKTFLGLFYLFFHSIFIQGISVIIKKVSYMSVSQLSLIRYIGLFSVTLPLVTYSNKQILGEKKHRLFLVIRALLGGTGLFLQIVAYRYLQLVEASIVMATYPIVTAVVARILLKEPLGLIQKVTLVTTVCGVLLSLRLPEVLNETSHRRFDVYFTIGLMSSLASVLCIALATVCNRKLKEVHFSLIVLYTSLFGMAENAVLNGTVFPLVAVECGWDQLLCILLAIFTTGSGSFFTLATQVEPSGLAANQKSSFDILIGAIFQVLFFLEYPDAYVLSGACLVLISLTTTGVKNWILAMPEVSSKRQKLKWILS